MLPLGCNFKDTISALIDKGMISTSNLSWRSGRYLLLAVKIEEAHEAKQRDGQGHFTEPFVFGKSYLGKSRTQKDNNNNNKKIHYIYIIIYIILTYYFSARY